MASHPFVEKIDELSTEFLNMSNDNNTSNISNTSTSNNSSSIIMSMNNPNTDWGQVDAHAPVMLAWCLWEVAAKGGLGGKI